MVFEFLDERLKPIEAKVRAGERLSFEDGVTLYQSPDLLGVGRLANIVRERVNGDNAFFIHNRHINPTNVCIHSCQFCAFGVKADHPDAYEKSLDTIFADAYGHERQAGRWNCIRSARLYRHPARRPLQFVRG